MYISMTIGNIVDTKWEIIKQVFENLFKFQTLDIYWRKYREWEW